MFFRNIHINMYKNFLVIEYVYTFVMGGNVKDAFTEEPRTTTVCAVCDSSFEHKYKYNRTVCRDCKDKLNDPSNLETEVEVDIDSDTRTITVNVRLNSTVHNKISIDIPTESVDGEQIIGVLRLEGDNESWYEDAWVENPQMSYDVSVTRGSYEFSFSWPFDNGKVQEETTDSVREEYQRAVGDLFEADTITVTFSFSDSSLEDLQETVETPNYLIDL